MSKIDIFFSGVDNGRMGKRITAKLGTPEYEREFQIQAEAAADSAWKLPIPVGG